MPGTPVTRIDLFTVRPAAVPVALTRMATDRLRLRRQPGLLFRKLLGTGDGRTFDVRDADLLRWGLLTVWATRDAAAEFGRRGGPLRRWRRSATEHWWATLAPLRTTGSWSGRQPFGSATAGHDADAAIVALTRARLRWSTAPRFWRAVPEINAELASSKGLLLRMGIGEAPVGLQGTLSLWRNADAMRAFAYAAPPHRTVIRRSRDERWYAEELFARFAVTAHGGTILGRDPIA
jgi:transposase